MFNMKISQNIKILVSFDSAFRTESNVTVFSIKTVKNGYGLNKLNNISFDSPWKVITSDIKKN